MTARVDGVIARIRKIHAEAKNTSPNPDSVENGDVIIFSHGHFTRAFIARWCNFPIAAGYHFSADPGGVSGVWARRELCAGRHASQLRSRAPTPAIGPSADLAPARGARLPALQPQRAL
jgi:broad specificity phosphatase PhoE